MSATVLVVDDDDVIREIISVTLKTGGLTMIPAVDFAGAIKALSGPQPDVILLDLQLPDGNGLDLIPEIKRTWPETEVIVLTGHATFDAAVEATKRGAFHFQQKPFESKGLLLLIDRAIEHKQLKEEAGMLRRALSTMSGGATPVFQSAVMKGVVRQVERIAPSDIPVLLVGESGAGKEVITDLIHALSPRSKGPLIKVNCAALPHELIESELFGSMKGAFTGALANREGLFRQAEGGTLLLDEISEMPIDTQSKLLRVLQEKEVRPVGGNTSHKIDCRVVSATNRLVEQAIADGRLRQDLYYRISTVTIQLPALRERRDDIMPMAESFLRRFAAQSGRNVSGFSTTAANILVNYEWPGNVRQLQNEVQRAVLMCEGQLVEQGDLSLAPSASSEAAPAGATLLEGLERNAIIQMLRETGGNKVETARRLGIGRQTLYNKLKIYGIKD